MSSYEVGPLGADRWDDFVASAPSGTAFNGSRWLRALSQTVCDDHRLVGVFKGDRLVGGVGLTVQRFPGRRQVVYSPRLTPYSGVVIRPRDSSKRSKILSHNTGVLRALSNELSREYDVVNLVNHPTIADIRPFQWEGWGVSVRYTYVVDVSDTDHLWDAVNSSVRARVRNCEDAGIEVTRATDHAASSFFELFRTVFERHDMVVPVKQETFEILSNSLADQGDLHYHFATLDGERIAGMAVVTDENGRAHEWQAATDPDHLSTGVAPFLRWRVIQSLSDEGFEALDLNGAGIESIAKAKSKFAGQLVPYYQVEHGSLAFKALRLGWDRLGTLGFVQRLRRAAWQ